MIVKLRSLLPIPVGAALLAALAIGLGTNAVAVHPPESSTVFVNKAGVLTATDPTTDPAQPTVADPAPTTDPAPPSSAAPAPAPVSSAPRVIVPVPLPPTPEDVAAVTTDPAAPVTADPAPAPAPDPAPDVVPDQGAPGGGTEGGHPPVPVVGPVPVPPTATP